ncbi:MAG: NAD dependent epimerase/dehydratase family protein, partial [Bacteroidetes bacterium]
MAGKPVCLVTGGNGLIGGELLGLLSDRYDVHAAVRTVPAGVHSVVRYFPFDLAAPWNVNALPAKADIVIHLAQSEKFREFPEKAEEVFQVNTQSTLHLLDYARKTGVRKFIYASSGGIYGSSNSGFTEDAQVLSASELGFYLGTKLCSEILVENYTKFFDVDIVRFFFVYGPRQRRSMLIPRLVDNVREGRPIGLVGKDGIRINPIHVSDAASVLARCIELPGSQKINIGGSEVL